MKTLVLAVIGPHGAGKTSFIKSVTSCGPVNLPQSPVIIEDVEACVHVRFVPPDAPDVSLYRCSLGSEQTPYILVDTPGLSAQKGGLPDHETITLIRARLDGSGVQLDGVIYLQRIMETSDADFAVRNLEAFHAVFKSDDFRHAVVATTFWDMSPEIGPMRDQDFVNDIRRLVSSTQMEHKTARLYNDFESSLVLLRAVQCEATFYVSETCGLLEAGSLKTKCCTM